MRREYEALSKLLGRNFGVLDDGTSVHLTPTGEIRDVNDKLLMGADEGRMKLYQKNKEKEAPELPAGATAHQQLVTDASGAVKWEDREFQTFTDFVRDAEFQMNTRAGQVTGVGSGAIKTLPFSFYSVGTALKVEYSSHLGSESGMYECIVQQAPIGENTRYIGNASLRNRVPENTTSVYGEFWPGVLRDTGEPFLLVFSDTPLGVNGYHAHIFAADGSVSNSHSFNISKGVATKYLPPEYITGAEPESHQMLVTDADGNVKWEERTHYAELVDAEVLSECEVQAESDEALLFETFVALPVAGEKYVVTWNGVEYECTAEDIQLPVSDTVPATVHCLGNCAAIGEDFGGTATDDPFFIGVIPPEISSLFGGATAMISPLDGSKSVTVKIAGKGERVHQLDKKYLGALRGQIICEIDAATGEASVPFATMWGMDASELQNAIVLKESKDDAFAAYAVTKVNGYAGRCIQFLVSAFEDAGSPYEMMYHWYESSGNLAVPFGKIRRLPIDGTGRDGSFVASHNGIWSAVSTSEAKAYLGLSYNFDEGDRSGVVLDSTTPDSVKRFFVSVDDTGTLKVEEITE